MTTDPRDWRTSPNALEFLPEEIAGLSAGTLVICAECQWPRPPQGRPSACRTCNPERNPNPPSHETAAR